MIVKVALPTPLNKTFDYLISNTMKQALAVGQRIIVPFGNRKLCGIVTEFAEKSDVPISKLKSILTIVDNTPLIDDKLFKLGCWLSQYYHHPLGETFATMLPALIRQGKIIEPKKTVTYSVVENITLPVRSSKQLAVINYLTTHGETEHQQLLQQGFSGQTIKILLEKSLITKHEQIQLTHQPIASGAPITLSEEQQHAVNSIEKQLSTFSVSLLFGITGSGKTEVYFQIIEKILQQNKQVLILIPEIGLTPQTVQRFQQRFQQTVALLHSHLNDTERAQTWMAIQQGLISIVIGTRSALFSPLNNLGLIVIDEEHDSSFKQHSGMRYSARDVAIRRAQFEDIPIILGSATPSLESFYNAQQGRYHLITLSKRVGNANIPNNTVIDLRNKSLHEGLSSQLLLEIKKHIGNKNQVLLFLNRRGYAPAVLCHQCGWLANCQRCDARYTVHQKGKYVICHHCHAQKPFPQQCPECNNTQLLIVGQGTEKLEETLQHYFPKTKITRIDRDTTRRKKAIHEFIESINQGDCQILIGTQMLAKGHHFPNVTMVGIIDIDGALFSSDFRANERAAQLLLQVAGRAGRADKPGEVFVQTHLPDHPLLQTLVNNDYEKFMCSAIAERSSAQLPPTSYQALIRAESSKQQSGMTFLGNLQQLLKNNKQNSVMLLGPIPSPLEKLAGRYRAQLLLQASNRAELHQTILQSRQWLEQSKQSRTVRWSIDIDPMDLT